MKVLHVIDRINIIEEDIKQLKELEKSLSKDKNFAHPIIISIEKQINILLTEKLKLLNLEIKNPPDIFIDKEREKQLLERHGGGSSASY